MRYSILFPTEYFLCQLYIYYSYYIVVSIQFLDGIVESVSYYIDNFINCESNLKAISKIIILAYPT